MENFRKTLMDRPGTRIVLAVLLFLSLTVLIDRYLRGAQLDLTEEGLYTLSPGTEQLLGEMKEPVTLNFYFSRSLAAPYPQLLAYGKRVEDLLRAFVSANPGRVQLSVIDPEPFSESEDDAVAAGLRGVPLNDGTTLYMGLKASNSTDGEAAIPFFAEEREKFLEYDLVKLIAGLDQTGKKHLTLLTTLPMQFGPGGPQAMMQGRAQPYVIYEQLQESFDIQELAEDFTELPADTDVLMIAQPPALSDDQLFAIDQYVLKGGRALVFLDPHSEAVDPRSAGAASSSLGSLLGAWGVDMPEGKVVGDASLAQRVQMGGYGADSIKDYVFWLAITSDFLASDDVVSGAVNNLNLASSGVLSAKEGATTTFKPLVRTSTVSMLFDAKEAVGMPDPDTLLKELEPTGESYVLAARVTGPAVTTFPDRAAKAAPPAADATVSKGDINLVLMADTDVFDDRFWVQLQDLLGQRIVVPIAGNGSFVMGLADHITGSEALIGLRGRGISKRPFEVVDDLRRDAETKYLAEEQVLQKRLEETEGRLADLESQKPDTAAVLSPEQESEVEEFRTQLLETRKQLRAVKHSLQRDIDNLGSVLAFINIALVPILVVIAALVRVQVRRRRLRNQD
ncbi:MAG: ABC transporter [Alphaproteobacteria bacterium]|nr:MAG: ABC transporter [Alphaproteobacteria bacterium]